MLRTLRPVNERLPKPLGTLEREFEGLFDRFLGPTVEWWEGATALMPRTNVAETATEYEVTTELPGMKPEDFTIEMKDGDLWITGEKKEEEEQKGKTMHRIERRYGQFRRIVPLPTAVNPEAVRAEYKEGVLHVFVPKTEEAKARRIEVKG
ncbi:MAG: Hsp20/alpha crystallin family protein [Pirellulales bacterium]|nr:Hsp20/alpha crystallin family protein [Pirellulales bacterium]